MSATKIEWTDESWNPVTGCDKVSPGCDHCYAETIANRFGGSKAFPHGFDVTLRPEKLGDPLKWRRPRRVFVNSMSDLLHDKVPTEFIARVFATMARAERHTFQVLTKRPARMRSLISDGGQRLLEATADEETAAALYDTAWPLPNVWLGVSAENQRWADIRIPVLLDTPAAVRFVSAEPLLGPIDLTPYTADRVPVTDPEYDAPDGATVNGMERHGGEWVRQDGLDWVIVGGESGPKARPMELHWAQELRDQCTESGVAFLFKQWGEWAPDYTASDSMLGHPMHRVGKKTAGRALDGRTWDQFPEPVGGAL